MFIRKAKYKAMQNEILRLTNVNEAWELQNKSDLAELRKIQEHNKELREQMTTLLLKHEEVLADYSRQSEELEAAVAEIDSLKHQHNDLARALHRASHSSHGGHRHGN